VLNFVLKRLSAAWLPSGQKISRRRTENAPALLPAYADFWSQTSPIPNADPEVALFLHGPNRSPASVQIG